jgi:hypothetical protein
MSCLSIVPEFTWRDKGYRQSISQDSWWSCCVSAFAMHSRRAIYNGGGWSVQYLLIS